MIPFVGPAYTVKRKKSDVQRSVNLMPTPIESGSGKSAAYLAPVPGLVMMSAAWYGLPGGSGGGGGGGGGGTFSELFADAAIYSCVYYLSEVGADLWQFDDKRPASTTYARAVLLSSLGAVTETIDTTTLAEFAEGGYGMLETATHFWIFGASQKVSSILKASPRTVTNYDIGKSCLVGFADYSGTRWWCKTTAHTTAAPPKFELWDTDTQSFTGAIRLGNPALADGSMGFKVSQFGGYSMSDGSVYLLEYGFDAADSKTSYLSRVDASGVVVSTWLPTSGADSYTVFHCMVRVGDSLWLASAERLVEYDTLTDAIVGTHVVSGPATYEDGFPNAEYRKRRIAYSPSRNALFWTREVTTGGAADENLSYLHFFDLATSTARDPVLITALRGAVTVTYYYTEYLLYEADNGNIYLSGKSSDQDVYSTVIYAGD